MTPKQAVEYFSKMANQDEELLIVWWDNESLSNIPEEDWEGFIDLANNKMDWSGIHGDLEMFYDIGKENYPHYFGDGE